MFFKCCIYTKYTKRVPKVYVLFENKKLRFVENIISDESFLKKKVGQENIEAKTYVHLGFEFMAACHSKRSQVWNWNWHRVQIHSVTAKRRYAAGSS